MPRSLPGPVIGLPYIATLPVVGSSKPAMIRSSVDFTHPEAPIMHTNSPFGFVRSISASASSSPSPTEKRFVTPRMVRMSRFLLSLTVLRAPPQQAVADRDDDPVGDESARANDDHAGDHEIGARQRAAVHHHGAEAGGNAGHFADHDQYPGKSVRDPQPAEDGGLGSRQHDLPEHAGAGTAEHCRRFEQSRIDRADAEYRIQEDRIKRAEKHQEDRSVRSQSKEDHRQRQPRRHRYRAQSRDRRIQQLPKQFDASDHQAQGNADERGETKSAIDALHRF